MYQCTAQNVIAGASLKHIKGWTKFSQFGDLHGNSEEDCMLFRPLWVLSDD